ncbi:radical SAM family heme chaperone HemW [Halovulum sp. GXIMD14793]
MNEQPWGGFGIYVHWPFCQSKCPYCDFNSHVRSSIDHTVWRQALVGDLQRRADGLSGRRVDSIFFGGGTPSLMHPDTVAAIVDEVSRLWPATVTPEVTLEANPTSVEADRFASNADAGVNRISLGIQALNDHDLKRLGRLHSAAEARAAFDIARAQFDRVSFDLIYGRQDQSLQDWRKELTDACKMAGDHLSLYQLTIEAGTRFGDLHSQGGLRGLPSDDLGADLYELTQDVCGAAGLPAYEVSNHAKPGYQCQHNLVYWRGGEYLGVGPGAHGRVETGGERFATAAVRQPEAWLELALNGGETGEQVALSYSDQVNEYLIMGLRLGEGISRERLASLGWGNGAESDALRELVDAGLAEVTNRDIRATSSGRLVLNYLIRELSLG